MHSGEWEDAVVSPGSGDRSLCSEVSQQCSGKLTVGRTSTYRARAAKVSMIRFSHSNCTALKTLSLELLYMAVTTVKHTAVMFTVN